LQVFDFGFLAFGPQDVVTKLLRCHVSSFGKQVERTGVLFGASASHAEKDGFFFERSLPKNSARIYREIDKSPVGSPVGKLF
jgi:hypothetical protein